MIALPLCLLNTLCVFAVSAVSCVARLYLQADWGWAGLLVLCQSSGWSVAGLVLGCWVSAVGGWAT